MNPFSFVGAAVGLVGVGLLVGAIFATGETRTGLAVTGLSLVPFGLIFFLVGRKVGSFRGVRPRLLDTGLPRRALVTRMWETGVTVNDNPVLGFEMQVVHEREEPYSVTVQQAIPRMLVGAVLPGTTLGIETDPEDRERVAIDWSITPESAPPAVDDEAPAGDLPTPRTVSAADLLARGRRRRATIVSMRRLGRIGDLGLAGRDDERWDDELFLMELEVKQAGADPITSRVLHRVPDRLVGKVGPGLEVPVAVDRDHPDRELAIDWDAVGSP